MSQPNPPLHRVILAVGSNINPHQNVPLAKKILSSEQEFLAESPFEETTPVGTLDQPTFLNGAFKIETPLDAVSLKEYLRDLEKRLGRIRTEDKNGPRTIDLDIIVFDGDIIDEDYHSYDFVKRGVDYLLNTESTKN